MNRTILLAVLTVIAAMPGPLFAQEALDKALQKGELRATQGAQAQQKVDQVHDETRARVDEYKAVVKQIEGLKVYQAQLQAQIARQEAELAQIAESVESVAEVDREIVPLMVKMVDGLEQYVAMDLPFLEQERSERIARLKELMSRADVSVAEQFRFVLAAFETELKYGNTIEAYRGQVGPERREVDILRIGRLALYYQTLDGRDSARWDSASKAWIELANSYNGQIQRGIRMAREQAAPDLIRLPLPTAESRL